MGRVFANGLGDQCSIPGRVIPKTLKMVLDTYLLSTQQYKVRIKGKVEQSRERSRALPTPQCCSYRKGSLQVALNYGWQLYFTYYMVKPDITIMIRVFANGPGDKGSIPGRVIPKSQKMVLDASLLDTQHYKVQIKGKSGAIQGKM